METALSYVTSSQREGNERSSISGAGHCKNHVWCLKRDLSLLPGSSAGKLLLVSIKTCKQNSLWLHSLHSKNTSKDLWQESCQSCSLKWEQGVTGALCRCCPVCRDGRCFTSLLWSYFPCSSRLPAHSKWNPTFPSFPLTACAPGNLLIGFVFASQGLMFMPEQKCALWLELSLSLAGWQVIKIKHIHISYD